MQDGVDLGKTIGWTKLEMELHEAERAEKCGQALRVHNYKLKPLVNHSWIRFCRRFRKHQESITRIASSRVT
jgi:hypothetical protein